MSHIPKMLQQTKRVNPQVTNREKQTNENGKLHNTNIKERLNLHVKLRLSGNVQRTNEMPKKQFFKPIQTIEGRTLGIINESVKLLQKQQKKRRPYTKRKDKSIVIQSGCTDTANSNSPAKIGSNNPLGNEGAITFVPSCKRISGGDNVDGGDEESQDTEVQTRLNDKEKNVDILNLVLSDKKRVLMQQPEVQDVLRRTLKLYDKKCRQKDHLS